MSDMCGCVCMCRQCICVCNVGVLVYIVCVQYSQIVGVFQKDLRIVYRKE